ncbi:hypothetical protein TNCV_2797211 [Trichonephila clavipes]|nr:hypothetical protein TNCV_2797211 [Trichonephila clavipes]
MDLVILNHHQATRTTHELPPPSPNFHTTLTEGRLIPERFNVHHPLYTAVAIEDDFQLKDEDNFRTHRTILVDGLLFEEGIPRIEWNGKRDHRI